MKISQKAVASMILTLVILSSVFITAFAHASDIGGHWAEKQIVEWLDKGFITGYDDGTFRPDSNITRAEFIILVNKTFDLKEKAEINFSDIPKGSPLAEEVAKAKAAGYLSGYEDGTVRPDKAISRLEAAKIISSLLKCDESCDTCSLDRFIDTGDIPGWGKGFLDAVVAEKYYQGYPDGTIRPLKPVTRAEGVTLLYKVKGEAAEVSVPEDTPISTAEQTLSGWLEDAHCAKRISDPAKGTKMCLLMEKCAASGYGIIVAQDDHTYRFYKFDENGDKLAKDYISRTAKEENLTITVKGVLSGETIKVTSIEEK